MFSVLRICRLSVRAPIGCVEKKLISTLFYKVSVLCVSAAPLSSILYIEVAKYISICVRRILKGFEGPVSHSFVIPVQCLLVGLV
jgi:hypothetical protein